MIPIRLWCGNRCGSQPCAPQIVQASGRNVLLQEPWNGELNIRPEAMSNELRKKPADTQRRYNLNGLTADRTAAGFCLQTDSSLST